MPPPEVRSPLGLPLGDRGLLPLPDALPAMGTGVVAGGPYTLPILKGFWLPLTGCLAGRVPTGAGHQPTNSKFNSISIQIPTTNRWLGRVKKGRCGLEPLHQWGHAARSGGVVGAPALS